MTIKKRTYLYRLRQQVYQCMKGVTNKLTLRFQRVCFFTIHVVCELCIYLNLPHSDNFAIAKCITILIARAVARYTESFLFHRVTFVEEASALLIDIVQFVTEK